MIKNILEKIINDKLGKYIKKLSQNQLKTDLLSGQVTLKQVELNEDYLNSFEDSPFEINHSSIGKLFIQAPLTKLSTVPVTLLLEDVYILMKVKDEDFFRRAAEKKKGEEEILVEYVQKIFGRMTAKLAEKGLEDGYMSKVMNRVIDNLTVKIVNVNIRVENYKPEEEGRKARSYAMGVKIEELSLHTADVNWVVRFLDRYDKKDERAGVQSEKVRKLIHLKQLKVYWESIKDLHKLLILKKDIKLKSQEFKAISASLNSQDMQGSDRTTLLKINSDAKMLINPATDLKNYQFDVSLELKPIQINFKEKNIKEIINFINKLINFSIVKEAEFSLKAGQSKSRKETTQLKNDEKQHLQSIVGNILGQIQKAESQSLNLNKSQKDQLSKLIESHSIESLLKGSMIHVKEHIRQKREKEMKKKNKGWFSKEKELTADEKQQLEMIIEQTYLDSSKKGSRPDESPFAKVTLQVEKITTIVQNGQRQYIKLEVQQMVSEITTTKDFKTQSAGSFGIKSSTVRYVDTTKGAEKVILKSINTQGLEKGNPNDQLIYLCLKKSLKSDKIQSKVEIQGQFAKILLSYENFLINKVMKFTSHLGQDTDCIKQKVQEKAEKIYNENVDSLNQQSLTNVVESSKGTQVLVSLKITSPIVVIPLSEKEYEQDSTMVIDLIKQNRGKQCWAFDLGELYVCNSKQRPQKLSLSLEKTSFEYHSNYVVDEFNASKIKNKADYSFLKGVDICGTTDLNLEQKQVEVELKMKKVDFSICYTQYLRFMRLFAIFQADKVSKSEQQNRQIHQNKVWEGILKKKIYKIAKGYHYCEYWAVVSGEYLYFYQHRKDNFYVEKSHLNNLSIVEKGKIQEEGDQLNRSDSCISQVQSEVNLNSAKVSLKGFKSKGLTLRIHISEELKFKQKIEPLLHQKTMNIKQKKLDQIIEQAIDHFEDEQDNFQDFDDENSEFSDCIQESMVKKSKLKFGSSFQKTSSKISIQFGVACLVEEFQIHYEQDLKDHQANKKPRKVLYSVNIVEARLRVAIETNKLSIHSGFSRFQMVDFTYIFQSEKKYQKLFDITNFDIKVISRANLDRIDPKTMMISQQQEEKLLEIQNEDYESEPGLSQHIQVKVKLAKIYLNWKPDVLIQIINFYKQVIAKQSIKFRLPSQNHKADVVDIKAFSKENFQFWEKKKSYERNLSSKEKIQQNAQSVDIFKSKIKKQCRLQISVVLQEAEINFFHKESHLKMFLVEGRNLATNIYLKEGNIVSELGLEDFTVFDTTGYPKESYIEKSQNEIMPYKLLFRQNTSQRNLLDDLEDKRQNKTDILAFEYVKYENPEEALLYLRDSFSIESTSTPRFDSSINITVEPIVLNYIQQPILRIIDYCLVQILILVTEPQLLDVNESLKEQLEKIKNDDEQNKKKIEQKVTLILFDEYEDLLKKLLLPLFPKIKIQMKKPKIILKAFKHSEIEMVLESDEIKIRNEICPENQKRVNDKFFRKDEEIDFFEQTYAISISEGLLSLFDRNSKKYERISEEFQGLINFKRLLHQNELIKAFPRVNFVKDYNINCNIPKIQITRLPRETYQHFLQILNCNVTFEDESDKKFIHNYQITKLKEPNRINLNVETELFSIKFMHGGANEPIEEVKDLMMMENEEDKNISSRIELFTAQLTKCSIQYRRTPTLDSKITLLFKKAELKSLELQQETKSRNIFFYDQLEDLEDSNKKGRNSAIIEVLMNRLDNSKNISAYLSDVDLDVNAKTLKIASEWLIPEDWVYPKPPEMNPHISFNCTVKNINIWVSDHNKKPEGFKLKGDLTFVYDRKQSYSEDFLKMLLDQNLLSEQQIKATGQNTLIDVNLAFQAFYFKKKAENNIFQRRVINKTRLKLVDKKYFSIRKSENQKNEICKKLINKSQSNAFLSDTTLKIALSDYLLFENISQKLSLKLEEANSVIRKFKQQNAPLSKKSIVQMIQSFQESNRENLQMKIQRVKILVYNMSFTPVIELKAQQIEFNKIKSNRSDSITLTLSLEANNFNRDIFCWQPFVEKNQLRVIISSKWQDQPLDERAEVYGEISLGKQFRVNISKSFVSAIYDVKTTYENTSCLLNDEEHNKQVKFTKYQTLTGKEQAKKVEKQYVSDQIIRNQTGYPVQIFDQNKKLVNVIVSGGSIEYENDEYFSDCMEEVRSQRTFGFRILHTKIALKKVTNIPLKLTEILDIKQKTVNNASFSDSVKLLSFVQKDKRVLLIRSNRFIKDYSEDTINKRYLPFDHSKQVSLQKPEKLSNISLFDNEKNQNLSKTYQYIANNGRLQIKKKFLVYNYTPIPLLVEESMVLPNKFVGISGNLFIQGIPYTDQNILKVVFDEKNKIYYLYSLSYIVDYSSKNYQTLCKFSGENEWKIKTLFSYESTENQRKMTIYLLPSIEYKFQYGFHNEKKVDCEAKIGKECIDVQEGESIHQFNVFSYLQSYPTSIPVTELKKVIEITESLYFANRTKYNVMTIQKNCEIGMFYIESGKMQSFFWYDRSCPQQFQITIEEPHYTSSGFVNIASHESFLIPHENRKIKDCKKFSLIYETTNNVNFLVLQELHEARCTIRNQIPGSTMEVTLQSSLKKEDKTPAFFDQLKFTVEYEEEFPLIFYEPLRKKDISVQIRFKSESGNGKSIGQFNSQLIRIQEEEIYKVTFQKKITLKNEFQMDKNASKKYAYLNVDFQNKKKFLKLTNSSKAIQNAKEKEHKKLQLIFKVPLTYFSLIGTFKNERKEVIAVIIKNLGFQLISTKTKITYNTVVEDLRVQNMLKLNPLFPVLLQSDRKKPCLMRIMFCKDLNSPNLIHYLGFSVDRLRVTFTSEEVEVLTQNLDNILKVNEQALSKGEDILPVSQFDKLIEIPIGYRSQASNKQDEILYFKSAEIHPVCLKLTFRNVTQWGGLLGKAFGNINNCKLDINGRKVEHFSSPNMSSFVSSIGFHFKEGIKNQVFSIIGSLGIISVPLNLISKIGFGVKDLAVLPAEGFKDGPLGIGKGVLQGTGSLLKNTFQGVFGGAQTITSTIGNGLSLLNNDEDYSNTRSEIKNKRSSNVVQGVGHGAQSIFHGITKGVTGVFTEPVKSAQKSGIGGFFKGGLKGVVGLVSKPATGIIDGVSKTAEGIKNTTSVFDSEEKKNKIRRQYCSRAFYGNEKYIKTYDKFLAIWHQKLQDENPQKYSDISYVNHYKLSLKDASKRAVLIISMKQLIIVDDSSGQIIKHIYNVNLDKVQERVSKVDGKACLLITCKTVGEQGPTELILKPQEGPKDMKEDIENVMSSQLALLKFQV